MKTQPKIAPFSCLAFYDLHDMLLYMYITYIRISISSPQKKTHMNHTTPASTHQIVPCLATIVIPLAGTPGDTSTCTAETGSGIHLDSGEMTKPYTSKHLLWSFLSPKHLLKRRLFRAETFTPSHRTRGFWMSREGKGIA